MIGVWSYLDEYHNEKKQTLEAIERVLESGRLILSKSVQEFEKEFSSFIGSTHGVGVGNGTDAIFIALKALGIGKGDEVITVPNTAIPTVSAIVATGATPKFVDCDPDTYLMDHTQIESAITSKTKCIVPVHLYGQCCDMDAITTLAKEKNLLVMEDCAQAHGALWNGNMAGSMSDMSSFSFYPTKLLGTYGDGGMVVTKDEAIAKKAKMLRMYGMEPGGEYYAEFSGYNSRLDELHAEILRFKLTQLPTYIKKRQAIAARYDKELQDTPLKLPVTQKNATHAYYVYVVAHEKRDQMLAELKKRDIFCNVSYKHPIHTMRGYEYLGYKQGDFPHTEHACDHIFSLPMYPELTSEDQGKVIEVLKEIA